MPDLNWIDVESIGVEGKGWTDTDSFYDRFPARAQPLIPPGVWEHANHSAGLCAHFQTNASQIHARWSLDPDRPLAMGHMPATGVSGLDLYVHHPTLGYRFLACATPDQPNNESQLANLPDAVPRTYRLYLPLYNQLQKLEIAVEPQADLQPIAPRTEKPILYYGTSITQGGCAARPGMAFPSIIGRRIDRPHINLGFSGNGRCEPEVIDLIAELDPCIFVIDTVANMGAELVDQRMTNSVRQLRAARPDTPILLIESPAYDLPLRLTGQQIPRPTGNVALQNAYDSLIADGLTDLHYLPGPSLLGPDCEGAVDGTHPTDLGFMRMADAITPALQQILK